jgi:hypothetical protein
VAMPAGRPQKNDLNIIIKDLQVNILSVKNDSFGNEVIYLKPVDANTKTKLKQIMSIYEANKDGDVKFPLFISDNGIDIILKAKTKFINYQPEVLTLDKRTYTADLLFSHYSMNSKDNGSTITGYYLKIPSIELSKTQVI